VLEEELDDVRDRPVPLLIRVLCLGWSCVPGRRCAAVARAVAGTLRYLRDVRTVGPFSGFLRFARLRRVAPRNDLLGIRPTVLRLVVAAAIPACLGISIAFALKGTSEQRRVVLAAFLTSASSISLESFG